MGKARKRKRKGSGEEKGEREGNRARGGGETNEGKP